ncbi:unnamed protein product [Ilex paraguariensis]|uniref:U1-type domain-containing protein n=1 Tax=Ilex paraguariensis TaxID=185542 RepID=A0ABC8TWB9_9AQUA
MVWFQCEDCGDNLKKPKLPSHFRICSATKLSCIDCGQVFGQQNVDGHTQCITEAEKYGPKGQGKASNGTAAKPNNDLKQKPDVDINVGLSERPPWFCSLCNTKATSKQALLLHAEGKKHRAKARAFHATKQQPKQTEDSPPNTKVSTEIIKKDKLPSSEGIDKPNEHHPSRVACARDSSKAENGSVPSSKKRKVEASDAEGARQKAGGYAAGQLDEVIQVERVETEEVKFQVKKTKHSVAKEEKVVDSSSPREGDDGKEKIKWKKLISSVLTSRSGGVLKLKKLRKLVLNTLRESGYTEDENQLTNMLEHKIHSSSRFTFDGNFVHLVSKS